MDKAYWLGRKRESLELAQNAAGSQARLVHYDLAGRYSVKAAAEMQANAVAAALPPAIQARRMIVQDFDDA